MLFNSFEFILLFLPMTLLAYFGLNRLGYNRAAKGWLVIASLYFYSFFNLKYLWLILFSLLFNHFMSHQIHDRKQKKGVLTLGILVNLGLIGYYKYLDFFLENVNALFGTNLPFMKLLLPLGISFFTFQQVAFLVDSYRGKLPKHTFLDYALFVTYFPQLIAGPIVLSNEMLPQFEDTEAKKFKYENFNRGLYLFTLGLAKKVIIADSIAMFANIGFDSVETLNFTESWLSSLAYTMQLYFDFSGYCDMAIGLGLMFNIRLPLNFNSPYKSTNIQEFWRRWHITLGRFLSHYLYYPLGGNRQGLNRTIINLFIVFLVSAIWHGAGWTFIIWGMLHGLSILIYKVWSNYVKPMNKYLALMITFLTVNTFWVFFRATSVEKAWTILKGLVDFGSIGEGLTPGYQFSLWAMTWGNGHTAQLSLLFLTFPLVFFAKNAYERMQTVKFGRFSLVQTTLLFATCLLLINRLVSFLYFNF